MNVQWHNEAVQSHNEAVQSQNEAVQSVQSHKKIVQSHKKVVQSHKDVVNRVFWRAGVSCSKDNQLLKTPVIIYFSKWQKYPCVPAAEYLQICSHISNLALSAYQSIQQIAEPMEQHSPDKGQRKKISKSEQLMADSEKFLSRPSSKIANPNKDLKQAYDKSFFKDKRFDHFRQLKKIRSKAEKDSVSSEIEEDEEFDIENEKQHRRRRLGDQSARGTARKRGRKPKMQEANTGDHHSNQHHSEAYIMKKRGRPKGSINKNPPKHKQKNEVLKIPKQFECLKKIEPKDKQRGRQSQPSQVQPNSKDQKQEKGKDQAMKQSTIFKQEHKNELDQNITTMKNGPEKEKIQSEQSPESEEEDSESGDKLAQNQKSAESSQEDESGSEESQSQMSSEQQSQSKAQKHNQVSKPKANNQSSPAEQSRPQQLLAPSRGKKLNIKSSSQQSQSQSSAQKQQPPIPPKQIQTESEHKVPPVSNSPAEQPAGKDQMIPEEQQLAKLSKRRGRKSQQTQLQIQRLKQIISKKKAPAADKVESSKQKEYPQMNEAEDSQEELSESEYQVKQPKRAVQPIISKSAKQDSKIVTQKERKPGQGHKSQAKRHKSQAKRHRSQSKRHRSQSNRHQQTGQAQHQLSQPKPSAQNTLTRKQIQQDILNKKNMKLALQSKIYAQQIVCEAATDPAQQQLFKAWSKHYRRYTQAIAADSSEEQLTPKNSQTRKRPAQKKFKKYRKVVIQEESQGSSEQSARAGKRARREKRAGGPYQLIVQKKGKAKSKHKQASSSQSSYCRCLI